MFFFGEFLFFACFSVAVFTFTIMIKVSTTNWSYNDIMIRTIFQFNFPNNCADDALFIFTLQMALLFVCVRVCACAFVCMCVFVSVWWKPLISILAAGFLIMPRKISPYEDCISIYLNSSIAFIVCWGSFGLWISNVEKLALDLGGVLSFKWQ